MSCLGFPSLYKLFFLVSKLLITYSFICIWVQASHAPRPPDRWGCCRWGNQKWRAPPVSRGRRRWTWWPGAWTWPRWNSTSAATGASTTPSGTTAGSWTRSKPTWYFRTLPCRGFQRGTEGAIVTPSQAVWAQTWVCDFFPDRLGIFFYLGHWAFFEHWSVVDLRCVVNVCYAAVIQLHMCTLFFTFFSTMIYHRLLNTVPCAIQ